MDKGLEDLGLGFRGQGRGDVMGSRWCVHTQAARTCA